MTLTFTLIMSIITRIIAVIIILLVGRQIIKYFVRLADSLMMKTNVDIAVRKFLESLLKYFCYCILIIILCAKMGIQTTSIVALLGSAGLAIGLALQGSLSNFAGGILILLMKPFTVGDYIIINNCEGTVQVIGLVYTTIMTYDNKKITVPNGSLANGIITNVTDQKERMIELKIGVGYNSDILKTKELFENICKSSPYVLQDKAIITFIDKLDHSSVNIGLRCWCKTSDFFSAKSEIQEQIKLECDKLGIEIPYNKLDVNILNK